MKGVSATVSLHRLLQSRTQVFSHQAVLDPGNLVLTEESISAAAMSDTTRTESSSLEWSEDVGCWIFLCH